MKKTLLLSGFLFFAFGLLRAQDIHWTQFYMSPLTLNPALTGDFEGTFRITGIYRDQFSFVRNETPGGRGFRTPSFSVDVPILLIRKNDWISAGVVFYADQAGTGGLTNNGFLVSGSYHLALDKKAKSYLVGGVQFGSVSRELRDRNDLTFEDNILNGQPGAASFDFDRLPEDGQNYSVVNAGLMYRSAVNKETDFNIGFAVSHITSPEASITTGGSGGAAGGPFERPLRLTLHGQLDRQLTDKFSIIPAFIFQNSASVNEIALQAMGGYNLTFKEKDLLAKAGLGYRFGDAIQFILGAEFNDWQVGLAYDFNVSDVPSSRGGFEIAASKIIKVYKEPEVPPVLFCPDL